MRWGHEPHHKGVGSSKGHSHRLVAAKSMWEGRCSALLWMGGSARSNSGACLTPWHSKQTKSHEVLKFYSGRDQTAGKTDWLIVLAGRVFVSTGFGDKDLEGKVLALGGVVSEAVTARSVVLDKPAPQDWRF